MDKISFVIEALAAAERAFRDYGLVSHEECQVCQLMISDGGVHASNCAFDGLRHAKRNLQELRAIFVPSAGQTDMDEPCCHRIVALMDRCKGLVAEVERLKARGQTGMDEARLIEINARANAATGGPWRSNGPLYTWIDALGCCERGNMHVFDVRGWGHLTGKGSGAHGMSEADGIAIQRANADFIAHARQDIPDLLRELAAAREEIALLTRECEHQHRMFAEAQDAFDKADDEVEALRTQLSTPEPSAVTVDEAMLRKILAEEIKERGGPQDYLDRLANRWQEIDSELPPELSSALVAMKRAAALRPPHRTTGEGG